MSDVRIDPAPTGDDLHALTARIDGQIVGTLTWNPGSGTIDRIEVDHAYRRRGIATALWHAARIHTPHLRHDGEEITPDGLAWAQAVGGPWNTPPERTRNVTVPVGAEPRRPTAGHAR